MPERNVGGQPALHGSDAPTDASPFSITACREPPFRRFLFSRESAPRLLLERSATWRGTVGRAFVPPGSPGPALFEAPRLPMHASELVELAAIVSSQGSALIDGPQRLSPAPCSNTGPSQSAAWTAGPIA